jgi:integral membrane protein (TIGR01906 family)
MKILLNIARGIFILITPVFLLTASIAAAFNTPALYEYGFEKYGVAETTGLTPAELSKAARGLIQYFNSDDEYISLTVVKDNQPMILFNQRELIHLKDVKALVKLDYAAATISGIYCLLFVILLLLQQDMRQRHALTAAVLGGNLLTLGLIVCLGLIAMADFSSFFLQFHQLSFSNDFWLLDPATDYLIMMFPEGFWQDAVFMLAGVVIAVALVMSGLAFWYLGRSQPSKQRQPKRK